MTGFDAATRRGNKQACDMNDERDEGERGGAQNQRIHSSMVDRHGYSVMTESLNGGEPRSCGTFIAGVLPEQCCQQSVTIDL